MANEFPLALQTVYADLLDRAGEAAFSDAFPEDGVFTPKTLRDRRYWYFQISTEGRRKQRYVGPETPELLQRIAHHKEVRRDQRDRQALVSTLVRSAHLPRPIPEIGEILDALAKAGVFRLRGVLVGTVAYQTYPAMLGTRLPAAALQTGDVDVAQFASVSDAVEDSAPPMLEVLQQVDKSFRPVPSLHDSRQVMTYQAARGIRVDFMTPNLGPESDAPKELPALSTHAQQLRFLDFLIHDPVPAVVLHGTGIYVLVPSPYRFAIHKLIVAQRRHEGAAKKEKDIQQAEALLDVLTRKRGSELKARWEEAYARGPSWKQLLGEGLGMIRPEIRDQSLKVFGATRSLVPGLLLEFAAPAVRYDFERDVVTFAGTAGGASVRCAVSRAALDDHFGADGLDKDGRLEKFREHREKIERLLQIKYLSWPVEEVGAVLLKTNDVPELMKGMRVHRTGAD